MRFVCLFFAVVLGCCAGFGRVAFAGAFRFQDLEHYYLQYCLAAPSDEDAAEARLDNYAVQYAERYFPVGSSASVAVSALTMAGAKCSVGDDPLDPPAFVCDWSRPDYGFDYFCCQIDWLVVMDTDKNYKTIKGFSMNRTESGP